MHPQGIGTTLSIRTTGKVPYTREVGEGVAGTTRSHPRAQGAPPRPQLTRQTGSGRTGADWGTLIANPSHISHLILRPE